MREQLENVKHDPKQFYRYDHFEIQMMHYTMKCGEKEGICIKGQSASTNLEKYGKQDKTNEADDANENVTQSSAGSDEELNSSMEPLSMSHSPTVNEQKAQQTTFSNKSVHSLFALSDCSKMLHKNAQRC